jgi:hypothetical protein
MGALGPDETMSRRHPVTIDRVAPGACARRRNRDCQHDPPPGCRRLRVTPSERPAGSAESSKHSRRTTGRPLASSGIRRRWTSQSSAVCSRGSSATRPR